MRNIDMITLLYIDPGTGSMLFAAVMGITSTVYFLLRKLWMQVKYRLPSAGTKLRSGAEDKKNIVIFSEGRQYFTTFAGICDELERRGVDCEYWTMDEEDPLLGRDYQSVRCLFIGSGNKAYAKLNVMNARVCLATTPGLDVYQWKRSPLVDEYVHVYHALANGLTYRMFGTDFYDTILLTGEYQEDYIRRLEQMREIPPKRLVVVGCPYMDRLLERKLNAENISSESGLQGSISAKPNGKVVLLAPSWGEQSIFHKGGEELLDTLLTGEYDIIVRPHPQSLIVEKELIDRFQKNYASPRISWDFEKDNLTSLMKADIMISDFSGVMFDFLYIFGKPVVFAAVEMDYSMYDQSWIDEPLWSHQVMQRFGRQIEKEDFSHINQILDEMRERFTDNPELDIYRDETWRFQGKSAACVADYLTGGEG